MKIKHKSLSYEKAMAQKPYKRKKPHRPDMLFRTAMRVLSAFELRKTRFKYEKIDMEKAGKGPYLILMNHSSFIDLKIASAIFYPMPYCIVTTVDAFVGKGWLMRALGCIPTQKFVGDFSLISDIHCALHEKNTSVLMYPEAGYSFDGCSTALPQRLGLLVKKLGVPVVTVMTDGAFLYDPLYNYLQTRRVKVTAKVKCLFSAEEVASLPVAELDAGIEQAFAFDNFKNQYESGTEVSEKFRADGLHRILYRCPECETDFCMEGKGTTLKCKKCGKEYELSKLGRLTATEGETRFAHVPAWYHWQRECVRRSLEDGTYRLDTDVEIGVLTNFRSVYMIGKGRLVHDGDGFHLTGCDGKLDYSQSPLSSHGLNADLYWYEMGDVICIGNKERLYYCFPSEQNGNVTRARLAAEELYKLKRAESRSAVRQNPVASV